MATTSPLARKRPPLLAESALLRIERALLCISRERVTPRVQSQMRDAAGAELVPVRDFSCIRPVDCANNDELLEEAFKLFPSRTPSGSTLARAVNRLYVTAGLHFEEDHGWRH